MSILQRIIDLKRAEIPALRQLAKEIPRRTRPGCSLVERLDRGAHLTLIAEIKRGSPSLGLFSPDLDASALAAHYEASGADGVSVLTDSRFWGGYKDLRAVADTVALPVLAKDFIIDPCQVTIAHALGADVVLLIAAALEPRHIESLSQTAHALGMEVILEVHAEDAFDADRIPPGAVLGINGRNLNSFQTSVNSAVHTLGRYRSAAPHIIAESGIHGVEQAEAAAAAGFSGILVGESLVRDGVGGPLARRLAAIPKGEQR